jgi:hypothetical protein
MGSIKFQWDTNDAKPAFRWSLSPNRGYRWRIRGAHIDATASGVVANRRIVCYLAQDNNGPHGQMIVDSGQFTAGQLGVGEGGVSTVGRFSATPNETLYTPWNAEIVCESWQQMVFDSPTGLQAGDTYEIRIHVEEEPADGQPDSNDAA